jgi:ATP-dependent exoDNAse (exonuclease V) beta subunit
VQAPAGSGKTTLLTERFLTLLGEVDEPGEVVAITFTNAAAAEMKNRILDELRKDHPSDPAQRALDRSNALGWKLFELPAQLRISTIDSFCRDLALQQPLLSGLGGNLDVAALPDELYRRAARRTLEQIGQPSHPDLSAAIELLLLWRDNNWQEMEGLMVEMLRSRDRWMYGFVLGREMDLTELRERLERPFANAVSKTLIELSRLLDKVPGARSEALELARFACTQSGGALHRELAELAEFPNAPFLSGDALEEARQACIVLAGLLLTTEGAFRKQVNVRQGFPADRKREKARILDLITALSTIPGLEAALAGVRALPPACYPEDDWEIVRACFTLLRHAAGELQVVFAEAGAVDFIEVAQIAQRVLEGPDGLPTDAALAVADHIRHLLVDEFQDTSRRQHKLLAGLIAAWPERTGRTLFAVGDPMQSIYFFRDADPELFPRVRDLGLEIPHAEPLRLEFVPLQANFRTAPPLVNRLNEVFEKIFAANDGSGVAFSPALPARKDHARPLPSFELHLEFQPQDRRNTPASLEGVGGNEAARAVQTEEIVDLIRGNMNRIEECRLASERGEDVKHRIAVLGRTRKALAPIAQALREASIPFRAIDLEQLRDRPEVLDALALARALLNPHDRVAWLGVLRAPWCGLSLADLHRLASDDDPILLARPVPDLLAERLILLSNEGRGAAGRVLGTMQFAAALRAAQPTVSLGTWLEQVWLSLGGADCVDPAARANLDLLWSCLDRLPGGEQDLFGAALDAALDKLTALPDPDARSDFAVQLMTIHKSKGLEFEVVIVPDLQAGDGRGGRKMLAWLERGLSGPDDSGEVTEFLVAPLQPKGEDRGKAKEWVDRVYRERESQEMRRILYVAATRAREELHLFAQPSYEEGNPSMNLVDPSNSLLATAWPALEEEVRARFEQWKAAAGGAAIEGLAIAASAESNLVEMPSSARPTILRRLPPDYLPAPAQSFRQTAVGPAEVGTETTARLYSRHQGGLLSRALGTAVHTLLEELARLRADLEWDGARDALPRFEPRIVAEVRAAGVDQARAARIAAEALQMALNASRDTIGQWVLSPHAEAVSEVPWAGIVAGSVRTVRADRVFRAGLEPLSKGDGAWWIIDYKTAHEDASGIDPSETLNQLRPLFAPQLETYAQVLRNLHGSDAPIRAGLYYPRMLRLDWWEA